MVFADVLSPTTEAVDAEATFSGEDTAVLGLTGEVGRSFCAAFLCFLFCDLDIVSPVIFSVSCGVIFSTELPYLEQKQALGSSLMLQPR